MQKQNMGDELHRTVKLALDAGEVSSITDARQRFEGYRLALHVGPDIAHSPTLQAAVLTALNTGRRCFLGGVQVVGDVDGDLRVPWRRCRTIREAVIDLQGQIVNTLTPTLPRIVFGDARGSADIQGFAVRATFEGWSGGVTPLEDGVRLAEQQEFPLTGVLAGALAVSEAFQFVRGGNVQAGRREVGLSLWKLEEGVSWLNEASAGPPVERLPNQAWLIGLGHLGQAYLWALGMLPYARPQDVQLVLQDYDVLVPANDSTSLLTSSVLLGEKKTRAMARWCEERGFCTAILERRFNEACQVNDDEPHVALCGVDNAMARAALEEVGFQRVIEAGLGWGTQEYLAFQVHTFPSRRSARHIWGGVSEAHGTDALIHQPAYQILANDGLIDQCGLTLLAGRSVGAAFVGAATAALVIAELVRMALGGHSYEIIDGNLRSLLHRKAIRSGRNDPFNPGYTKAIS
jgi:hypothetical protein